MIRTWRIFLSAFLLIFVAGCGAIQCVDAQFERKPIPIDTQFKFQLIQPDQEIKTIDVKCERYYNSMCSERGNSWQIREVNPSSIYGSSQFKLNHSSDKVYQLELPRCRSLVENKRPISLKDTQIVWGRDTASAEKPGDNGKRNILLGKSFRYVESEQNVHTYKYGGYTGKPLEIIKVKFTLTLNGKEIAG